MSSKKRKRHTGLKIFLGIIVICIVGAVVFWPQIKKTTSKKAAEVVVEKMLDNKLSSDKAVYGKMTAKDIYNSMDTEDKQKVTDIITNHMTPDNVKNVEKYVASGDKAGLEKYAKDNLSTEETKTIQSMYEKYKEQLKSTTEQK
jgi:hypothetical protein